MTGCCVSWKFWSHAFPSRNRNSRRGRTIGTREAQPKQFPQPGTPHTRWVFSAAENPWRLIPPKCSHNVAISPTIFQWIQQLSSPLELTKNKNSHNHGDVEHDPTHARQIDVLVPFSVSQTKTKGSPRRDMRSTIAEILRPPAGRPIWSRPAGSS
jgi:hypothetical protein